MSQRTEGHERPVRDALTKLAPTLAAGANNNPRSLVRLLNNLLVDYVLWPQMCGDLSLRVATCLAVSRILRHGLGECYNSLVDNDMLCAAILAGGIASTQMESRWLQYRDPSWPPDALPYKPPGPPSAKEIRIDELLRSLASREHLTRVLDDTETGGVWLTEHDLRRQVNDFIVPQRAERPIDEFTDSERHVINVWRLADGALVRKLRGHWGKINAIAVTPDGTMAVSGSDDSKMTVWDLESGEAILSAIAAGGAVTAVAVSADGKRVVFSTRDTNVMTLDVPSKRLRPLGGHIGAVNAVGTSADGNVVVSGADDMTVRVWNLATEDARTLVGHTGAVKSLSVTPDGKWAASGSVDGTIMVWDLVNGRAARTIEGHSNHVVYSVAMTPDRSLIVSGGGDSMVVAWDLETGKERQTCCGHSLVVNSVAVTPDGGVAVSGSHDNAVMVWDLHTGRRVQTIIGHTGPVLSVAIAPEAHLVLSCE